MKTINHFILVPIFFTLTLAHGEVKTENRAKLTSDQNKEIEIKEALVEIQGKTFKKIEYKSDVVYVELLDPSRANEDMRILCQRGLLDSHSGLVKGGIQVAKRARVYLEGLTRYCRNVESKKELEFDPEIFVGLQIDIGSEKKNRKIILSPFDGVSFKADW